VATGDNCGRAIVGPVASSSAAAAVLLRVLHIINAKRRRPVLSRGVIVKYRRSLCFTCFMRLIIVRGIRNSVTKVRLKQNWTSVSIILLTTTSPVKYQYYLDL